MEGEMFHTLLYIVSGLLSIFSVLVFVRILLSWFSGAGVQNRLFDILCGITDPYLNYFRRFRALRIGNMDLSPIVALAVLSIVNNVVSNAARFGAVRIGMILALCLGVLWSAASFIIGFFAVVLVLRLIAYLVNANIYSPFWQIIDSVASPVQFRINRILFRNRIVKYPAGLIASIATLGLLGIVLGIIVGLLDSFFVRLPI
jgi:YggT family protein